MAETPEEALEAFCYLSECASDWFERGIDYLSGIDPATLEPLDLDVIRVYLTGGGDEALGELGEFGPPFCGRYPAYADALAGLNCPVGIFTVSVGFVGDLEGIRSYRKIPNGHFPSAHAAAAEWVSRIGHLFFSEWNQCEREDLAYPAPYFGPDNRLTDARSISVASIIRRICVDSSQTDMIAVRMKQERVLLKPADARLLLADNQFDPMDLADVRQAILQTSTSATRQAVANELKKIRNHVGTGCGMKVATFGKITRFLQDRGEYSGLRPYGGKVSGNDSHAR